MNRFRRIVVAGIACSAALSAAVRSQSRAFDFRLDVGAWLARAGCSAAECHGGASGRGGFKLSLFGSDPIADHRALTGGSRPRIDRSNPNASRLLRKPSLDLDHDGGLRLPPASAGFRALREWIAAGAVGPGAATGQLRSLVVTERDGRLITHAVSATGVEDLSDRALFRSSDPRVVTVDDEGRLEYHGSGRAAVTAKVLELEGHLAVVRPFPRGTASTVVAVSAIDRAWMADLGELGLSPAAPAHAHELLRRVYLDLAARLPTPRERREFLESKDDGRAEKLVDRLLADEDFVAVAVDWLAEVFEWDAVPASVADRLARVVRDDESLLAFAAELIASRSPLLWRAADPRDRAELFARSVLGVRMQCARCHDHPMDRWRQDDHLGLAAYFVDPRPAADRGMMEGLLFDPRDHRPATPSVLDLLGHDDGNGPLARRLAAALAASPRALARNFANRIARRLAGAAPKEPVDDHRDGDPARSPALLDALTERLIEHEFRVRPFVREIVTSAFYARGSLVSAPDPTIERAAREYLACHPTRELDDATAARAVALALDLPVRHSVPTAPSPLSRSLAAWNAAEIHDDLLAPGNALELIALEPDSSTQIEALFRMLLGRDPRARELQALRERLGDEPLDLAALRALAHSIILSREFRFVR
ncbi:MAG: DUF1549 domain-containing protein [Planctomycetota bacterium]